MKRFGFLILPLLMGVLSYAQWKYPYKTVRHGRTSEGVQGSLQWLENLKTKSKPGSRPRRR